MTGMAFGIKVKLILAGFCYVLMIPAARSLLVLVRR